MTAQTRPSPPWRPLAVVGSLWLTACPAPPAGPAPSASRDASTPSAAVEPESATAPVTAPTTEPTPASVEPSVPTAISQSSALAHTLWTALEELDAGDPDAMTRALAPTARWFPPGSPAESIGVDEMPRAMANWSGPDVTLDIRRVIDPGVPPLIVQLVVERDGEVPLANEIVLLVDGQADQIASVRQHGDPLGPIRERAEDSGRTLDLGPVGQPSLERGEAPPAHVGLVGRLVQALEARDADATQPLVAQTAVLHDIQARRTHRGRSEVITGLLATLGEQGHLTVQHQYATASMVVVEGAVFGREQDPDGSDREHGFVDIYRLEGGEIVETWRYLDRRGRPHRRKVIQTP
ncbi:MAG: nuclear transport factor 2 family protein [Nannocystaceae bacterium]